MIISDNTDANMGDICKFAGLENGSFTTTVDDLINKGLLEREHSNRDRRKINLKLTNKGHLVTIEMKKLLYIHINYKLKALTSEEVKEFTEAIQVISKYANKMLGMSVQLIYNLVDAYFVGKLNDPNKLAAVNLAMPIFMMLMAISEMLGNGGASNISRALGEKDFKKSNKIGAMSFYSCIAVSIIVTILGLIYLEPIVRLLGANKDTFEYTYILKNTYFWKYTYHI